MTPGKTPEKAEGSSRGNRSNLPCPIVATCVGGAGSALPTPLSRAPEDTVWWGPMVELGPFAETGGRLFRMVVLHESEKPVQEAQPAAV